LDLARLLLLLLVHLLLLLVELLLLAVGLDLVQALGGHLAADQLRVS